MENNTVIYSCKQRPEQDNAITFTDYS